MENQPEKLDEAVRFKRLITVAIIILVVAVVYKLIYLPVKSERQLKQCLKIAEENYSRITKVFDDMGKDKFAQGKEMPLSAFEKLNKAEQDKKMEDDRCYMRYK